MKNVRNAALLLAAAMLTTAAAVSCGDTQTPAADTQAVNATEAVTEAVTEAEPDPFAEFDYQGQDIRVYTSINNPGGVGNSNYLIEGPEEETGDLVQDSAYSRNRRVEEILNVKLVYTEYDANYSETPGNINKLIMSGDDLYDIMIVDLFPAAGLSCDGNFLNIAGAPYIDLDKPYWYRNYMEQLSLDGKKMFLMAGDYFIDVLRSAHAMYFNKNLLAQYYDDADVLYNEVLNGTWTYDKFLTYISEMYRDVNGDGTRDLGDQYGFGVNQIWGPSIPFLVSADLKLVDRNDDGTMTLAMNNENSVRLLELLNDIFYNDATINTEPLSKGDSIDDLLAMFKSGQVLMLGYHRLGSFENLRDMEYEVGILPYPKFNETQKDYVTSSHDTTEIGVIPVTCSKFDTVCAVLEVLNRETEKIVLPAYYETGLKVKYSRDDMSSQMIDIIHGNIGGSFALAYSNNCNAIFQQNGFYTPLSQHKTDFVSNYVKIEKGAQKQLNKLVDKFSGIDQ
ncbi:MAG: hypothetical protein MJ175_07920 [Clostridia bacterium]|nr:hypothetical protein [Clostridia bacterium]